eukprot:9896296-Alexandrium_andersonii.AAC.1
MEGSDQAGLDALLGGVLVEGVARTARGLLVGQAERSDVLAQPDRPGPFPGIWRPNAKGVGVADQPVGR